MASSLTPIDWSTPLVDAEGRPTATFSHAWQQLRDIVASTKGTTQASSGHSGSGISSGSTAGSTTGSTTDSVGNLPTLNPYSILANPLATNARPPDVGVTLSSLLDSALGSAQGTLVYRDAAAWTLLPPGISGQILTTQGVGANPKWADQSKGDGTAAPPEVVQSATARWSSSTTSKITLAAAPIAGNVLVAIWAGSNTVGTSMTGFTTVGTYSGTQYQSATVAFRLVLPSDGVSWVTPNSSNGGCTMMLFEVSGLSEITYAGATATISSNTIAAPLHSYSNSVVIGLHEEDYYGYCTSLTGATLLYASTDVSANHPVVYFKVTAESFGNVVTSNWSTTSLGYAVAYSVRLVGTNPTGTGTVAVAELAHTLTFLNR